MFRSQNTLYSSHPHHAFQPTINPLPFDTGPGLHLVLPHAQNLVPNPSLTQPLVADQWYNCWFYVSRGHDFCSIEHIGAYFSEDVSHNQGFLYFDYEPQVESDMGFLTDTSAGFYDARCICLSN